MSAEATLLFRIASGIHDGTLLRVGQHFLCQRRFAELLRGLLRRIDVWVILARELAVCLLDFRIGCIAIHTEDAVVVSSHDSVSPLHIR